MSILLLISFLLNFESFCKEKLPCKNSTPIKNVFQGQIYKIEVRSDELVLRPSEDFVLHTVRLVSTDINVVLYKKSYYSYREAERDLPFVQQKCACNPIIREYHYFSKAL
ncbi:MAG: hypothetical protein NZM38_02625 [Cytophagales bacterium]|nr:hypothetical protein [Cytophagales bacterium]MDW8383648.1 hypothetical protein [Flammeovirgaceae bacterium]